MNCRDSEDSAPAEFPPEQPEADIQDDDAEKYGAEEVELEQALVKEYNELGAQEEDDAMEGAEGTDGVKAEGDDDVSDVGSEDLEAESSGSEDEEEGEEEGEEGEEQGDGDVEMGDGDDGEANAEPEAKPIEQQHEVMVH